MAAVAATVVPWISEKCLKSILLFRDINCMKNGHENLTILTMDDVDEEKMKAHIIDCAAALGLVQQVRVAQGKPLILREGEQPLSAATQAASNRIFAKVVSSVLDEELTYEGAVVPPSPNEAMKKLLRAFPDCSKLIDGRGWLPLHWGMITVGVTEADIKLVYSSDPMALQRHHLQGTCVDHIGLTPAHLLCMQAVTNRSMSLIRTFSEISQGKAFTMSASYPDRGDPLLYGFSALHALCAFGQPTEELLQYLLQLDSSQTKKMCNVNGTTPLGYLFVNNNSTDPLIRRLMEVDSSTAVIGSAVYGCLLLVSSDSSRVSDTVEMLLKANPEAAKYRKSNGVNLLHSAARQGKLPLQVFIDVMNQILAVHKDAVREVDNDGWLPVHCAARYCTAEVMECLLDLYPESASVLTTNESNLLRLAAGDKESTTSVMEAKVRFLYSRYPAMIFQKDSNDDTPLLTSIVLKNIPAVQILCEAGGQELISLPVAHPTDADYWLNGWLPLHYLITWNPDPLRDSLLSKAADCFRMMLRMYPEAAGIEGGVGVDYKKTPYQLAVDKNLPPYYLRLLLRAAPDLNPAELHRLNYAERRMAMFLAFEAQTKNSEPLLLARLRFAKKDLVVHVISFL